MSKFGSIDSIYSSLDTLDIKKGVHDKLAADRDMAYLSRTLGTIRTDAPIDTDYADYIPHEPDAFKVTALLSELEMFKMIERLDLKKMPPPHPPPRRMRLRSAPKYTPSRISGCC